MDLTYTPEQDRFRAEVRAWLTEHMPRGTHAPPGTPESFQRSREWDRELFDAGYSVLLWPRRFGGREASVFDWLIFEEEYHRAGAPYRVSQNGISLLAPTLMEFGTPEQQERLLVPMARGEVVWAQAWSEPGAGSDLASLISSARRDGAGWRLSGQKIWSSHSVYADRAFGLFRTGERDQRHRGLTYFLIDLRAEGVTIRSIPRLDGHASFAEIFFDDVFVPDTDVLGEVGQGWSVAMATTGSERGFSLRSPGRFLAAADRLLSLAARLDDFGTAFAERVVDACLDAESYHLRTLSTASRLVAGGAIGPDSSYDKLFWSDLDVRITEIALELQHAAGVRSDEDSAAVRQWLEGYVTALPGTIWGGTSEIQRNIVAQRVLGLPKG